MRGAFYRQNIPVVGGHLSMSKATEHSCLCFLILTAEAAAAGYLQ